jgi:hypothetical protein
MKHNTSSLPLLQWVNGSWQPNVEIVSASQNDRQKKQRKKTKTQDIQSFTQLSAHKLPKIGECLIFQSYIIWHQGRDSAAQMLRDRWKIYQETNINH